LTAAVASALLQLEQAKTELDAVTASGVLTLAAESEKVNALQALLEQDKVKLTQAQQAQRAALEDTAVCSRELDTTRQEMQSLVASLEEAKTQASVALAKAHETTATNDALRAKEREALIQAAEVDTREAVEAAVKSTTETLTATAEAAELVRLKELREKETALENCKRYGQKDDT